MKKVVIIGPAYPLRGGLAAFNQRFAKELKLQNVDPVIYTFKLQYPSLFFPGKSQIDTDQIRNGIDIRSTINSISPANWLKVAREIVDENPDLVICRYWIPFLGPSLGSILRLVKKGCKAKIIALVDNFVPHEKRLGDTILTDYFISPVDYFLVMCRKVKRDIQNFGVKKPIIQLAHPLYDHYGDSVSRREALDYLGLSPQMSYLLFFGFIRKYKGLDLLLTALAQSELKDYPLRLIVAGEFYEKEAKYRQLIMSLGLSKKVIIRPEYIPNREVKYYFSAADLVVLPYRSASQSGISQIAGHFMRPVLITKVGGLPEIVEDGVNGFISEPDPILLARRIKSFFDLQDKEALQRNIELRKEKFSWSKFTQDFLSQVGLSSDLSLPVK